MRRVDSRGNGTQSRSSRPSRIYTQVMSVERISEEFVRLIAADLRRRYALDDDDVSTLGARLASPADRSAENLAFAERFTDERRETFDRLAE